MSSKLSISECQVRSPGLGSADPSPLEAPEAPEELQAPQISSPPSRSSSTAAGFLRISKESWHLQAPPTCRHKLAGSLETDAIVKTRPSDSSFPVSMSVRLCPAQPSGLPSCGPPAPPADGLPLAQDSKKGRNSHNCSPDELTVLIT